MGLSIRLNSGTGMLLRSLNASRRDLFSAAEKISSGLRINRASDDPAGLVISEHFRSQIAGLNQEIENTSMLINKYETASATVGQLRSQLTELRSLAVGAANEGGNSEAAQQAYTAVGSHVTASYNRVIDTADYNGANLLDGSDGSVAAVDRLSGIDLSTAEGAAEAIATIDEVSANLDQVQSELGAYQKNELEARQSNLRVTLSNLQAAESSVRDADYAFEISNFIAASIRQRASIAMMAHTYMTNKSVLELLGSDRE